MVAGPVHIGTAGGVLAISSLAAPVAVSSAVPWTGPLSMQHI